MALGQSQPQPQPQAGAVAVEIIYVFGSCAVSCHLVSLCQMLSSNTCVLSLKPQSSSINLAEST
jgi:hypothetical protein